MQCSAGNGQHLEKAAGGKHLFGKAGLASALLRSSTGGAQAFQGFVARKVSMPVTTTSTFVHHFPWARLNGRVGLGRPLDGGSGFGTVLKGMCIGLLCQRFLKIHGLRLSPSLPSLSEHFWVVVTRYA